MAFDVLKRLFRAPKKDGWPPLPPGERVVAIGDIHGRADLLAQLLAQIDALRAARPLPRDLLVCLGDYVDRGPDSAGVVSMLIERARRQPGCIFLRGNHDDTLQQFLNDAEAGPAWMSYGGRETLLSYGVPEELLSPPEPDFDLIQREFRARLPGAHKRFYEQLVLQFRHRGFLFVHAGLRPGVPISMQAPADLMWIREDFLKSQADFGAVVVHGHTPGPEIDLRHNRIGLDTGAFASGNLTALIIEGTTHRFLQTAAA